MKQISLLLVLLLGCTSNLIAMDMAAMDTDQTFTTDQPDENDNQNEDNRDQNGPDQNPEKNPATYRNQEQSGQFGQIANQQKSRSINQNLQVEQQSVTQPPASNDTLTPEEADLIETVAQAQEKHQKAGFAERFSRWGRSFSKDYKNGLKAFDQTNFQVTDLQEKIPDKALLKSGLTLRVEAQKAVCDAVAEYLSKNNSYSTDLKKIIEAIKENNNNTVNSFKHEYSPFLKAFRI